MTMDTRIMPIGRRNGKAEASARSFFVIVESGIKMNPKFNLKTTEERKAVELRPQRTQRAMPGRGGKGKSSKRGGAKKQELTARTRELVYKTDDQGMCAESFQTLFLQEFMDSFVAQCMARRSRCLDKDVCESCVVTR